MGADAAYLVTILFLGLLAGLYARAAALLGRKLDTERKEWRDRETRLLEQLTGTTLLPRSPSLPRDFGDRGEWEIERERLGVTDE